VTQVGRITNHAGFHFGMELKSITI